MKRALFLLVIVFHTIGYSQVIQKDITIKRDGKLYVNNTFNVDNLLGITQVSSYYGNELVIVDLHKISRSTISSSIVYKFKVTEFGNQLLDSHQYDAHCINYCENNDCIILEVQTPEDGLIYSFVWNHVNSSLTFRSGPSNMAMYNWDLPGTPVFYFHNFSSYNSTIFTEQNNNIFYGKGIDLNNTNLNGIPVTLEISTNYIK